ncbi:MULE transposase, conserved domain protein, partial [mine drainage metagenome]
GDFAMIVVVRDSVSGFVLHSGKCFSESEQSIVGILNRIKMRFGIPSGTISDMRAGILSAIGKVFPGVPMRVCLLHFLRDLGKDL